MKILLLSFYYTPDIGPGPLRARSIVEALQALGVKSSQSIDIDVLTTLPNRYHSLQAEEGAEVLEHKDQLTIQRFKLPVHQSGMRDQAKAFSVYAYQVMKATKGKQWDVVIATSSRLMTAALGAWVAKQSNALLYLDIRDLFIDTMEDILAKNAMRFLLPLFRQLERRTFRAAAKLNVVSPGFLPCLRKVAPEQVPSVWTNGIDEGFLNSDFNSATLGGRKVRVDDNRSKKKWTPLVVYAGNIGEGQGLHHIIPQVARILGDQVRFRVVGDGGRRRQLEDALKGAKGVTALMNVEIVDPVPREQLIAHYQEADILFLHLNDYKAFKKVLPSKIFEYAATGKPILAGVAGYSAGFLRDQVPGVFVFDPCDAGGMAEGVKQLLSEGPCIDRSLFCERYRRASLMQQLALDVVGVVDETLRESMCDDFMRSSHSQSDFKEERR